MALTCGNAVAGHLTAIYKRTAVGADTWVKPDEKMGLVMFQVVAAAARALEDLGRIQIIETHEEDDGGTRLIGGLRIRRLR